MDTATTIDYFLAKLPVFKDLPKAVRWRVAQAAREKAFAKGETVFKEGEQADAVWIVKEGRVHLMKFLADGHVSTTCVITQQEWFCCLPALDRKSYPADAVSATDATVIRIPMTAFSELMDHYPAFRTKMTCLFCDRLRQVEAQGCLVFDPVERRLAKVLVTLGKKFGNEIPLTKQELAEVAGTTVETAIRVLSDLKKQGIVDAERGKTIITDARKLATLAEA